MENFKQLCVWPGTLVGLEEVERFESFFKDEFGVRIKYAEEVLTNPDPGETLEQSGGRNDVLFWVHDEDIAGFAIKRLQMGIRWWEDVIKYNDNSHLYTKEILDKYLITW
jgi:hypothetical protein